MNTVHDNDTTTQDDDTTTPHRLTGARALTDEDPLLAVLERRLAVALGGGARCGTLGLRWPAAAASRALDAVAFRTNDVGGYGPLPLDPTLDVRTVTARFARIPEFARTDELNQARLIPCADEAREELLTNPIPMNLWITFDTTVDGHRYRLQDGRWHEIGQRRDQAA